MTGAKRFTDTPSERAAAAEMAANHIMISYPEDGHLDWRGWWGVCVGSHGGHATTLKVAMRRCLKCCGIGKSWTRDYGEGPLLRDYFAEIADKYLDGLN